MTLREAQNLISEDITLAQLDAITPIYNVLGFDKEYFAELVKAIGVDKWIESADRWLYLSEAEFHFRDIMNTLKASSISYPPNGFIGLTPVEMNRMIYERRKGKSNE